MKFVAIQMCIVPQMNIKVLEQNTFEKDSTCVVFLGLLILYS